MLLNIYIQSLLLTRNTYINLGDEHFVVMIKNKLQMFFIVSLFYIPQVKTAVQGTAEVVQNLQTTHDNLTKVGTVFNTPTRIFGIGIFFKGYQINQAILRG